MHDIDKNTAGLTLGSLFGLAHLGWAILVALNQAKPLLDWVLGLHFMVWPYAIKPFSLGTALGLIIFTSVVGYVLGWVAAALWNAVRK